jgi:hypothetical protein
VDADGRIWYVHPTIGEAVENWVMDADGGNATLSTSATAPGIGGRRRAADAMTRRAATTGTNVAQGVQAWPHMPRFAGSWSA